MLTGYLTWMPTYLYERFDMDLAAAGFHSMFYTHLFAFVGILIAGRISDRIAAKHPASRMAMQGIGLLAAVPFIVMMGHSSTLWIIYLGFAGFGFARAFFDANTYTVLYDVVPERYLLGVRRNDHDRIRHRSAGTRHTGCRERGGRTLFRHYDAGRRMARMRRADACGQQTVLHEKL